MASDPAPDRAVRGASSGTRARLLRAGLALARKGGLRAITVRALAQRARANPGSFVYHFGTRDAFLAELLEQWYAPLMTGLQLQANANEEPLTALRALLLQMLGWVQDNAGFVAQLLLDAAAGEVAARRFLATLQTRHPAVLLGAIVRAQQARRLGAEPPLHQLFFLMSSVALPVLLFQGFNASRVVPPALMQQLRSFVLDAEQARRRLEWALRGLAPAEG